ncbi:hypothetical protein [Micromonospora sp. WMMD708]|uniref:hypothetical protein n=1 Tax=Micromonospora sp. WMMD708 TaxID=3403464 RepID=UPI003BF4BAE2
MLHRGIKFAYATLSIVSAIMAFIVLRNFDEATVAGPSYVITFDEVDDGADGPHVADMIVKFSRSHGVNVGRAYSDPRNENRRRVYMAVGNPQAESTRWLRHGYPNFSREGRVEFRPYDEIRSIHPDGIYYVFGSKQAATLLRDEFKLLGYHGEVEQHFTLKKGLEYFGRGALLWCFIVVAFAIILAVASSVTLNAKSYGIQRLQGQAFLMILWRDVAQLAVFCAGSIAASCVAAAIFLYLYSSLNRAPVFAIVALSFAGVFILLAFATHVVTLGLICRDPILNSVKGEATADWAIVGAYLMRIATVALIFSVTTSAIGSSLALKDERANSQTWAKRSDAYYMRISNAIHDEKRGKIIEDRIGQWIRNADARNEAALAWRHRPHSGISGTNGFDLLVVNNKYLVDHEVYDFEGARVQPINTDEVRVMVPEKFPHNLTTSLQDGVTKWVSFQSSRAGTERSPDLRFEKTLNNQDYFSYARSFSASKLIVEDAIVVVITGASGIIPSDEYASIASRGEILFENPDQAMKGLADAGMGPYILGMSPFTEEAARDLQKAERDFNLQIFNLAATVMVLFVTALALSIVYSRRNSQALFVKYICGWSFLRTHRSILATEGVLTLALILWTWHSTTTAINSYKRPGGPPPPPGMLPLEGWEPVLAGGVAFLSLLAIVLALLGTNRVFVKKQSSSLP